MAKGRSGQRRLPRTPPPADAKSAAAQPGNQAAEAVPDHAEPPRLTKSGFRPLPEVAPPSPREIALVKGTGCVGGHPLGAELDAGPLGQVPTSKATWIGLAVLAWCGAGLLFMSPGWLLPALLVGLLWWVASLGVQRRAGHRGKCWRIRAWRHAWGGLVPKGRDPTRPAEDED